MSKKRDERETLSPTPPADVRDPVADLQTLFELSLDMLCVAGIADGYFRKVNPAFTRTLGFTEEELLGKPFIDFVHPDDRASTAAVVSDKLARGVSVHSFDNRYRTKDGDYRWLTWTSFPVPSEGVTYAVARDDTTRKQLEEELHQHRSNLEALVAERTAQLSQEIAERKLTESALRQSEKMRAIGQLAGGVAHDLNNILTAIQGYVELAAKALRSPEPRLDAVLEMLQQVERNNDRAARLIRQLLAFSRRQVTQAEVMNLNTVLRNMETMLRRLIAENIDLEFVAAPDLGNVRADPTEIEQVLMNLVVNARDAIGDHGTIRVRSGHAHVSAEEAAQHPEASPGPHAFLEVEDTGPGIDPESTDRIFEPFFTTKTTGEGIGLGLSTVYGIVKQAGGFVTVASQKGRGATFRTYLPIVDESIAERPEPAAGEDPRGDETILLCEDDDAVRELAEQTLRDAGYTVLAASGGLEALDMARGRESEIRLLLTDVIMPGLNGRDLSLKLSASIPGLETLFVSGYTSRLIARQGILEAGVELLEKPFDSSTLLRRVRELLDAGD